MKALRPNLIIKSATWTLPVEKLEDDSKTATVRYVPLGNSISLGTARIWLTQSRDCGRNLSLEL